MKRPWIVRELPSIGKVCAAGGLLCLVLAFTAFFNGKAEVAAGFFALGCAMWPMGVAMYAMDYCCRAIEEMSQPKSRT